MKAKSKGGKMQATKSLTQTNKAGKQEAYLDKIRALDPKARLLHWIRQREQVRITKSQGKPKPWTDDPILQSYRFCNVRRMDDRVSEWLEMNWYVKYYNHQSMVIAAVLARHFNQPSTLARIGFPIGVYHSKQNYLRYATNSKAAIAQLKVKSENIIFNSAYIIRADGKFPNKVDMVFDETVQQFVDDPPDLNTDSMERCVEELMHYRNIGSFMAGQIAADLRWGLKGKWADKDKWAAIGPGSKRGMNILHNREIEAPLKQEQFVEELRELIAFIKKALPTSITSRLEAIDYQNCLCEMSGYEKVLWGRGRKKQLYDGGAI